MSAKILVADDSATIQTVIELTFSREDVELIPARSGEEAIRKAKEVGPDLMLLDTAMPDMSGYEVCRALKADPAMRDLPVILLAGPSDEGASSKGQIVEASDVVTKPFESLELITKVKQLLDARPKHPAAPRDLEVEMMAIEEVEPLVVHLEDEGPLVLVDPPTFVTAARAAELPGGLPREIIERAVTNAAEQTASQVARDVTEKLVERIEQIVREVVPALAESLIMKEIERIKATIESKTTQ